MATAKTVRPNPFNTLRPFASGNSEAGFFYSLPALAEAGFGRVARMPFSLRIILESLLRNCDGRLVSEGDVRNLAEWDASAPAPFEVPFTVARVVLQDFTGVPLLVDLAAMRSAARGLGADPGVVEPLVPVDLVVDHSVQVDFAGNGSALCQNMELEFQRNRERYRFLKWGTQAFKTFKVTPPGMGIVHQVNLEYLARSVFVSDAVAYPDSLVGTDSHTTMINGLGVVGWGVGGIEAEAAMLGHPVTFLAPEVVGVFLTDNLAMGVTATDLVLRVTELLRETGVVGKFVEFYGPGAAALSVPDRATLANMAPEYGATTGFFGVDDATIAYLRETGRDAAQCRLVEDYYRAQELWGVPIERDALDFTRVIPLSLASVEPCVAGPRRPQERVPLKVLKEKWKRPVPAAVTVTLADGADAVIAQGCVLIAAITSCTNTSNPSVMIAAGLLAQKANALGLRVNPLVKTSLGPGSRVVTAYLEKTGLQAELDKLGFQTVGYGCTTCIGNSGPLDAQVEEALRNSGITAAAVLSGNRNFEARVHPLLKANFLMSPPLVVAFAIAGTTDIDLTSDPLGKSSVGELVYLRDIWPAEEQIAATLRDALDPELFKRLYAVESDPRWEEIPAPEGDVFAWEPASTYIQEPPFFKDFSSPHHVGEIRNARALGVFGDSVTTDHISPAGNIRADSPAGCFLREHGIAPADFNSYGSRRGNDRIMTRGTFANVRIKNLLAGGVEGGVTRWQGEIIPIFDAAQKARASGVPLVVIGGEDYGMGSSRDWAAKGTALLGVCAVIAKSFERIHRSNLVGMGVLPLVFKNKTDYDEIVKLGEVTCDIPAVLADNFVPKQEVLLRIRPAGTTVNDKPIDIPVVVRIDTPVEADYYRVGGILPYMLSRLIRPTT
ncbi:MAG: aconitate hydratase AcnA [Puniceicoccales bacterium]|jgi:aconitate hydratase|nr:aconitate hydratase AcnA [Puniceicoccales bacterium]